ncbi:MAG TPA: hypothetical protein P5294_09735 [Smithellaceae bacterium]|nr:hypothetical protein [Smithellaceae bacterium]HRS90111.1 hypothetical protein [Smithellaceae bacterium]HRV26811.1 hypothetical protein [Smithellaceae bacterium]
MKTYAIKYVELGERHAEKMAKRWALDVQNNIHTKKYKELPEDEIIRQSLKFYQHFSKMFLDEKIKENTLEYFRAYAQESFAMDIPMNQAVYALILLRRHIWLYAEFQVVFSMGIEQRQALDTLNRTILLFDHATYEVTKEYQRLMKKEQNKK